MTTDNMAAGRPGAPGFPTGRRKGLSISPEEMVRSSFLSPDGGFLEVIEPAMAGVDLLSWAAAQREDLERRLLKHGALLFRGLHVPATDQFQSLARFFASALLDYKERAAPRNEVAKSIYTSTEFPPDQHIPMHHEM